MRAVGAMPPTPLDGILEGVVNFEEFIGKLKSSEALKQAFETGVATAKQNEASGLCGPTYEQAIRQEVLAFFEGSPR